MAEPWLGIVEKVTEFFATSQIAACARRTGFVRRTSKITGKVFLALVMLGAWSACKTSLGQLAAKAAHLPTPVEMRPSRGRGGRGNGPKLRIPPPEHSFEITIQHFGARLQ